MVVLCSVIIGFHQVDSAWSVPDDAEVLEGEMMTASEAELTRRAMRRRRFFRRLLGERRWSGRLEADEV